jgi:hypothetical protein
MPGVFPDRAALIRAKPRRGARALREEIIPQKTPADRSGVNDEDIFQNE